MRRRTQVRFFLIVVGYGLFMSMVVGSWPLSVLAQESCSITQITNTPADVTYGTTTSADGTNIVFTSTADLTGANPDRNQEIFLFDAMTDTFTQVTSTPTGYTEGGGAISGDGTRIALVYSGNPPGGNNPDGSQELFLYDTATGTLTQITNIAPGEDSFGVGIDAHGTRLVVGSTANLTGGNPNHSPELFLYDTATNTFTQITNTGFSVDAVINADGTRIAFVSFKDLTGGNADGDREIFLYDTTTHTFTQITNTTGSFSIQPSITADGTRIAFASGGNPTGENPDGSEEIFLFDTTTNTFTQITHDLGTVTEFPKISADGTRIAFTSNGGGGGLFLFDLTTHTLTRIADGVDQAINADGTHIAFLQGSSVFLATCGRSTADLALTQTDAPDPVLTGQNLTYTLTVTNNGPSAAANAALDDPLPANTTFQSFTAPAGWSCTTPAVGSTGMVHCETANLASGATASFALVVKVSGAAAGTTLSNTATASSPTADPNSANNSATATTTVTTPTQAIKLLVTVQGQGTVTSNPAGISCRPTCSATYSSGTSVSLSAAPASGWRFDHWAGDCTGTTPSCTVSMTQDRSVTAVFVRAR